MKYMDYPIPLLFTPTDIEHALAGALVTKVIYLEDPEKALPAEVPPDSPVEFPENSEGDAIKAAIANGRLVLGLLTVVVFSLGFATVLVVVGTVVARLGQSALGHVVREPRWLDWLQIGTASVVTVVGLLMTINAWQQLTSWQS
jgi:hypothetical protein